MKVRKMVRKMRKMSEGGVAVFSAVVAGRRRLLIGSRRVAEVGVQMMAVRMRIHMKGRMPSAGASLTCFGCWRGRVC